MKFPDRPHLLQLQRDLWQWPNSKAAVMIGAGFSLNADSEPGVKVHFPTWRQLVRCLFDELYPVTVGITPDERASREHNFNRLGSLRIASEYEAAFGRQKLDNTIRKNNPDTYYRPGELHRKLLQLPWVDVFTTNYDTLLERTEIPGRSYHPVTKVVDLSTAFAPRIVKLHGSFPSQTPFILTEEDFRTYPKTFAPFVNTVQQSLLENTFVLLGFSGDDPNFLSWTGWIRDELGYQHAPIYLVGSLSIGNAERSLLSLRGVTPIDLSNVVTISANKKGTHRACLEWFLGQLTASRPPRPGKWPNWERQTISRSEEASPNVIHSSDAPDVVNMAPAFDKGQINVDIVRKVVKRWRYERELYPGWIVLKDNKRKELWENTRYWLGPLFNFTKDWRAEDKVLLYREMNWRLETAMVPLFEDTIEPFQKAIEELHQELAEDRPLAGSTDCRLSKNVTNSELRTAWLEIALGLLREARESYKSDTWSALKIKINKIAQLNLQYLDRCKYEEVLWAMWNVKRMEAKTLLSVWIPSSSSPLASLWKAGLLSELDVIGEAQSTLRSALSDVRRVLHSQGRNIELLSIEGWCTYLLFAVEQLIDFRNRRALLDEFSERWEELNAWDCSPWPYKEYFDHAFANGTPEVKPNHVETRGFDPGQVTTSWQLGGNEIESYLPGFAGIRLFEQVGIPMRLSRLNIAGDTLVHACRWIAPFIGFWSPAILVRAANVELFRKHDFLSRTRVATMKPDLALSIHKWCMRILVEEIPYLSVEVKKGSLQGSLLEALTEVLSRLAFQVGTDELKTAFPISLRLHNHPIIRSSIHFSNVCQSWFERLFYAVESDLLFEWLPDLIRFPLLDEETQSAVLEANGWRDPMEYFPIDRIDVDQVYPEDLAAKVEKAIDWLLRKAAGELGEGRRRALMRLIGIYHIGLMQSEQIRRFGGILWELRDPNGLPDLVGYRVILFLHLPAPDKTDVPTIVKQYLLTLTAEGSIKRNQHGQSMLVGGGAQRLIAEISIASKPVISLSGDSRGTIEWTSEEAKDLYYKAREWWANDKEAFEIEKRSASFGMFGSNAVLSSLDYLGSFLSRAIFPHMEWANDDDWKQLHEWLTEVRQFGSYPSEALPNILLRRPEEADSVNSVLQFDIESGPENAVSAAAKAIRHWINLSNTGLVPTPPERLLKLFIDRVAFRQKPGIVQCLYQLNLLILDRPEALKESHAELLLTSLTPWYFAAEATSEESAGEFAESERSDLRVQLGMLAGSISDWLTRYRPGTSEPARIGIWRESCASDHLPEVRRAFGWNARIRRQMAKTSSS